MPTFFGRRYGRPVEAVSGREKLLGALVVLLLAATVVAFVVSSAMDAKPLFAVDEGAYAREAAASPDAEAGGAGFPASGLADWLRPARVERFTVHSLFARIDGRADAYLERGCEGLKFGRYTRRDDPEHAIDVYWYDMGSPENALRMYRFEQAPGAAAVDVGQVGYQVGGAVFFCAGASYVQVLPNGTSESDVAAALKVARQIAARIEP